MRPGEGVQKPGLIEREEEEKIFSFSTNLAAGDYMVPTPLLAFL